MAPQPLYEPGAVTPCYKLRYGWTGWPTVGTRFPDAMESLLAAPSADWEVDHLRLLEYSFSPERVLMTFSVTPQVSPVFFVARVKGRLQHALRQAGTPVKFSRKVAMVSIGENHREDVEQYIQQHGAKEAHGDSALEERLRPFTVVNSAVDLSLPSETTSGRYWYNLHLVLVHAERWRNANPQWLGKIRDQSFRIAEKKGYEISRSVGRSGPRPLLSARQHRALAGADRVGISEQPCLYAGAGARVASDVLCRHVRRV